VRTRCPGDYLQIGAFGGRKKLKNFFVDEKVPQRRRDEILLLADGPHILWVVGYRMSEAYKVTHETKRILCVCVDGGQNKDE
jgi:tRNA(Ile)-lysidine synthase